MSEPNPCRDGALLSPVIDRNRCEAKGDCVRVCPYHVFEIGSLSPEQRAKLSFIGRTKAFFHGNQQAFAVRPDDCHACGLCVTACPEKAIKLSRRAG
ncbi:MAG TPA: ferredoxin family protein [Polyangiales bacterium]|nr:ferredoxin family protein [Polyangiales bacterium]